MVMCNGDLLSIWRKGQDPPAPPPTQLHTCSFLPVYLFPLIPESFSDSAV